MLWVDITFRGRGPSGSDLPRTQCEQSRSGPFSTVEAAELFAQSVANSTAVLECRVVEEGAGQ